MDPKLRYVSDVQNYLPKWSAKKYENFFSWDFWIRPVTNRFVRKGDKLWNDKGQNYDRNISPNHC